MDGSCVDRESHDLGDELDSVTHTASVCKDGYYSNERVKKMFSY